MNKKWPARFNSAMRKAESLANDVSRVSLLLSKAILKAEKNKSSLKKVWEDLTILFRLAGSWVSGKYREAPLKTIVLAIAAIIYFVNPFDVIPDLLPLVGYIDDASVIVFVIATTASDIGKFRDWELSHS